jgi:hypothetical protein
VKRNTVASRNVNVPSSVVIHVVDCVMVVLNAKSVVTSVW